METELDFIFTPDNLLANLDKLGAWSIWHLLEIYAIHFHSIPDELEYGLGRVEEISKVTPGDFKQWVEKYHKEVGYSIDDLKSDYVNAY